jgi:hypothetical protein
LAGSVRARWLNVAVRGIGMTANDDDGARLDRRHDVRIIVSIGGRFSLADRRDPRGERRVYACRAVNLSPRAIALASAVSGKLGDRVIADIDHLGRLEGEIICLLERGFVMSVFATDEQREKLVAKIEWLQNFKDHDVSDQRADQRVIPASPYSRMMPADGSVEACLVIDVSVSGAAVSAEPVPEIGTVLPSGTSRAVWSVTLKAASPSNSSDAKAATNCKRKTAGQMM